MDNEFIVESIKDMKSVEIGTILFNTNKEVIGKVIDIFGKIREPFYSVSLNYNGLLYKGMDVCILNRITKYVDVNNIKVKGTDASNKYDEEPSKDELIEIECTEDINNNENTEQIPLYSNNIYQDTNTQYYPPLIEENIQEMDNSRYTNESII